MLLLFLFFTPTFCLLRCTGGPKCHIKLPFNQKIPSRNELFQTCSIVEVSSCFVYLKVNYKDQQVNILFGQPSNDTNSSYPFMDLLTINPHASVILRYTIKVQIHDKNQIRLYILFQCRTNDHCALRQLRHFWPRFTSLNERRNSFFAFSNLLFSNISNVSSCFNDQINQTEQCSTFHNICWASTNKHRKCRQNNKNHFHDFIYSYNKVDHPHQLTDENVHYILACHVNNCNNNKTIDQLSGLARQFAENSWPNKYKKQSSLATKLIDSSYINIFYFGLILISKNIFCII